MKPFDQAEPKWARYCGDVFPFLVSLENICRGCFNLFFGPTVLFHAPHAIYGYSIMACQYRKSLLQHNEAVEKPDFRKKTHRNLLIYSVMILAF